VEIEQVVLLSNESHLDKRGYFRRVFDREVISEHVKLDFLQASVSFSTKAGTLRGMHFQANPSREWKLVTCLKGRIFDCLVDVRNYSQTYGQIQTIELSEESGLSILIPPGVAHGFQTLDDDTYVFYQMTDKHRPELSRRLLWNDATLNLPWPRKVSNVSPQDSIGDTWPVKY
jgi:dTDP-4-dehydrorhamnose 3,5-epimerase